MSGFKQQRISKTNKNMKPIMIMIADLPTKSEDSVFVVIFSLLSSSKVARSPELKYLFSSGFLSLSES